MKKLLFILLLIPMLSFSQKSKKKKIVISSEIKLSEDFTVVLGRFFIVKSIDVGVTGFGGNVGSKAEKGYKFIEAYIRIRNNSEEKKIVDLSKFQIVDENNNVYDAYLCQGNNLNKKNCNEYKFKIRPNKKRIATIDFAPLIPEKSRIKILKYEGKVIYKFE